MFQLSNQYIRKVKIEKAKRLLIHTCRPLNEIAAEVGFERFYFGSKPKSVLDE
jgi:AraC-like DNA-binding protein